MDRNHQNGYEATIELLRDHHEWYGMVQAALEESKGTTTRGFAGSWVLERARKHGVLWVPNLRKLVSYGILLKDGESTRGGRRSYYTMPDPEGVSRALKEVQPLKGQRLYSLHEITGQGIKRKETIGVPYYATLASCGGPNMSEAHIDDFIDVSVEDAKPGHNYFLTRADGDSMDEAGIQPGDTLLVREQNYANDGDRVVACVDGGVTVKEYRLRGSEVVLFPRSSNPEHKPMVMGEDDIIQGIIIKVTPNK